MRAEYDQYWKINDILPVNSVGIVTARDSLTMHFNREDAWNTVNDFSQLPVEEARERYNLGKDAKDWKVELAQKDLRDSGLNQDRLVPVLYRPFDVRHTYYTGNSRGFHGRPRKEVMKHMRSGDNIGLVSARSNKSQHQNQFICTQWMSETKCGESTTQSALFPLYLLIRNSSDELLQKDDPSRKPNLSPKFIEDFATRLKMAFVSDGKGDREKTFGPEDIFSYMYAVFHAPTYRLRYAEFLKIDFPRLPFTSNPELFRKLCALGDELTALHLMERHGQKITGYPVEGDNLVEAVRYTEPLEERQGCVWINAAQYFEGVSPEVWAFHVGGYQVCAKWLKDRKGRNLGYDDLAHYQHIVAALAETIKIMERIDKAIDEAGGWPIS
jgi:predicted helicase